MFENVPKGVALPGIYTQLTHDRREDYAMTREWEAPTVLILQPDSNKVSKVWKNMMTYADPNQAVIILRKWDWDDGRTEQNPKGVYQELYDEPIGMAVRDVQKWRTFVDSMRLEALSHNRPFPSDRQIRCHLVNEPDTNSLASKINQYTTRACTEATPVGLRLLTLNFGTGHPAIQVAGPGTSPDWGKFKQAVIATIDGDHTIGTHEYFNTKGMSDPSILYWHILRHYWAWSYLVEWDCLDIEWWITEWGFEGLVNNDMDGHHGWNGVLEGRRYATDCEWYSRNVACFIQRALIFCSDLPDRTWWTFDPLPARTAFDIATSNIWAAWNNQQPILCEPDPDPDPDPVPEDAPMWPCDGEITQRFGANVTYYGTKFGIPGHNGLDIGNAEGSHIVAIADGVVEWSDWDENYGWYIRIWHAHLFCHSFYAHLQEKAMVHGGEIVDQGRIIGKMGNTGNSTGPHLHFETRMGERYRYFNVAEGYRKGRCNPEAIYATYGLEW